MIARWRKRKRRKKNLIFLIVIWFGKAVECCLQLYVLERDRIQAGITAFLFCIFFFICVFIHLWSIGRWTHVNRWTQEKITFPFLAFSKQWNLREFVWTMQNDHITLRLMQNLHSHLLDTCFLVFVYYRFERDIVWEGNLRLSSDWEVVQRRRHISWNWNCLDVAPFTLAVRAIATQLKCLRIESEINNNWHFFDQQKKRTKGQIFECNRCGTIVKEFLGNMNIYAKKNNTYNTKHILETKRVKKKQHISANLFEFCDYHHFGGCCVCSLWDKCQKVSIKNKKKKEEKWMQNDTLLLLLEPSPKRFCLPFAFLREWRYVSAHAHKQYTNNTKKNREWQQHSTNFQPNKYML